MTAGPYMARALALARRAKGLSNPNPPVGAVVVRDGAIVGEGRTQSAGGDHAEVVALRQAGAAAEGAALYVTLEPCRHYGRTPPCVETILAARLASVNIAAADPSPLAGGGGRVLGTAGVRVSMGEGAEEAEPLYRAHWKHAMSGVPWVIAKFAASLDGKIATRTGESRWITGARAREEAHRLRSHVDAVMVGAGTVVADDPQLTARPNGRLWPRQPLRVVVGGADRVSPSARVFHEEGQAVMVTRDDLPKAVRQRYQERGVETLALPAREGKVDLVELLRALASRPVTSVLVEGGGALLGSFFDQRLVDEVYAFLSPTIIGGATAVTAVGGRGAATMAEALRLQEVVVRRLGPDLLVRGLMVRGE